MLVFETAEGLVIKEHAGSLSYVTIYVMDESIHACVPQPDKLEISKIPIDTMNKPPCEYTWNEMRDYLKTLMGLLAIVPSRVQDHRTCVTA